MRSLEECAVFVRRQRDDEQLRLLHVQEDDRDENTSPGPDKGGRWMK